MPRMVKKTMELNQDYIDMACLIFSAKTEKEAVNKALEMAVIDNQIIDTSSLNVHDPNRSTLKHRDEPCRPYPETL